MGDREMSAFRFAPLLLVALLWMRPESVDGQVDFADLPTGSGSTYFSNLATIQPQFTFAEQWAVNFSNADPEFTLLARGPGVLRVFSLSMPSSAVLTISPGSNLAINLPLSPCSDAFEGSLCRQTYLPTTAVETYLVNVNGVDGSAFQSIEVEFFPDDEGSLGSAEARADEAFSTIYRRLTELNRFKIIQAISGVVADTSRKLKAVGLLSTAKSFHDSAKATEGHLQGGVSIVLDLAGLAADQGVRAEDILSADLSAIESSAAILGADGMSGFASELYGIIVGTTPPAGPDVVDYFLQGAEIWVLYKGIWDLNQEEFLVNANLIASTLMSTLLSQRTIDFQESDQELISLAEQWVIPFLNSTTECTDLALFLPGQGCGFSDYDQAEFLSVYRSMERLVRRDYIDYAKRADLYVDVDGDGYGNRYETDRNADPNDPSDFPSPSCDYGLQAVIQPESTLVSVGENVTVTGDQSTACAVDNVSYAWSIETRPAGSAAALWAPAASITSFVADEAGIYSVRLNVSDGFDSDSSVVNIEAEPPNDFNVRPYGDRLTPDYRTDQLTGQVTRFKIRAFDSDCNLSHIIWGSNGPASIQESDSRDDLDDGCEDTESMNFSFDDDNAGNTFDIFATIYDTDGASRVVQWKVDVRQTFGPVVSALSPLDVNTQVPLGRVDFEVEVFDQDDNTRTVEWIFDGLLVDTDTMGGGNPASQERVDIEFGARDYHTLTARATDNDGLVGELTWMIEAGTPLDGNIPPNITYFGLDRSELPYQWMRAGRPYSFRAEALDSDDGVIYYALEVNGVRVRENTNNVPDFDEAFDETIVFPAAGEYLLEVFFRDASGETVSESLSVDALVRDASSGTEPVISSIYPPAGTIYNSGNLSIGGIIEDAEWDAERVLLYLNGQLHQVEDRLRDYPGFRESVSNLPDSGNHALELVVEDEAGNRSSPIAWNLRQGQTGSRAPSIELVLPDASSDTYVLPGENVAFFVFVSDPDGDLEELVWDMTSVGDPDPLEDGFVNDHFDVFRVNVHPTQSGTFPITVYDAGGRSDTISVQLNMGAASNPSAPKLLNHNLPDDGAIVRRLWDAEDEEVGFMVDVWDPDGDLVNLWLTVDGVIRAGGSAFPPTHDFDSSFLSDLDRWTDYDLLERGKPYEFEFVAEDAAGNRLARSWTMMRGPVGPENHGPLVAEVIDLSMNQRDEVSFDVAVADEEGDIPSATMNGLLDGEVVSDLGNYQFEFIPDESFFGNRQFEILWNDGFGGVATTTVNVTVNQVILPPDLRTQQLSISLLEGERFGLGNYLDLIATSEEFVNSELIFDVVAADGISVSGSPIVGDDLFELELVGDLGSLTGIVVDPGGRSSEPLTINVSRDVVLEVQKVGSGEGSVRAIAGASADCGFVCVVRIPLGAMVTLEAQPAPGSVFGEWAGACSSSESECLFSATNDAMVSATFKALLRVGGTVRGLEGSGLVLWLNGMDALSVGSNASFFFSKPLADDSPYDISVKAQPTSPAQTCSVENGSGVLRGSEVDSVRVVCTTDAPDLAISKNAGTDTISVNRPLTYRIVVRNSGSLDAVGAIVNDVMPAELVDISWICQASGGAICESEGSGDIEDIVNLPVGSAISYFVTARVRENFSGVVRNTASVIAPAGISDGDLSNNQATDESRTVLFASGFEAPRPN